MSSDRPPFTREEWRKIFLDLEAGHPELRGVHTEERFFPLRSAKGLTSGEHFVRYLFAAGLCSGKRVLDVACGPGYGSYILKLLGASEVVGVDRDAATVDFARRTYMAPGLEFHAADATTFEPAVPALDSPFDVIVSFETLEHLHEPDAFLENVKRRLAPGGLFLASCPHDARSLWVSPFHIRRYTYAEFRDLVGRYFPDPLPLSQIHGMASLILSPAAAAADDLALQPLERCYLDAAKSMEESDIFLLLCGPHPADLAPTAVITKRLTEFLHEIFGGAAYLRERVPHLESTLAAAQTELAETTGKLSDTQSRLADASGEAAAAQAELAETTGKLSDTQSRLADASAEAAAVRAELAATGEKLLDTQARLADARAQIDRQARQFRARSSALEDQKAYTLELQQQLEDIRYSRTWQLMLTCREALSSPLKLLRLPFRVARILIDPAVAPVIASEDAGFAATATPVLPEYLPHRRSAIAGWPAGRPLVTVGIPCYNYGRFVREAIDSVLASTFQDFEIIVVNDGSTDPHTLAVLAELEKSPPDRRLRVAHQPNQGLAAARNKGAALALGKYVVSLDADDRIAPTYLEKTVWVLERHPQYGFCYSLVQRFGVDDTLWKTEPFSLEKALRYNHVPTGAVFRHEAWVEAGGFRDELYGQDDWNFWITLGAKGWDGYLVEEPLFFYRTHESSMWSNIKMAEREYIAEKIRSLNAYITGQGSSSAAEQFNPPKDPMVRAALDHPAPPPQPPLSPLAQRPHLAFGDGRPALLFAIPWMAVGGAEQVVLQVMQGLAADYALAAITTLDVRHDWEQEFARLTPWIYHLAHLPLDDPSEYFCNLVAAHNIAGLIISGSAHAYQALPALKLNPGLWTADIVHNTVPEGYLDTSIRCDPYLDCHFAVGKPQRDALIRKGGVGPEKTHLAHTAADAAGRFNPAAYAQRLPEIRRSLSLKGSEIVLTYTGRLAVEKDVPLFVRVVGELVRAHPRKRFQAFIVGDGPERARIDHEVRVQGLQDVIELLGFCDNVAEILAVSHFAFLTSRFEGSSITLLEAMSMGLVVLSTEVGSVRDVIEDGVNGFIIPSRVPADFAARVAEALADPARDAAICARARQVVLERYDLSAMVRVYSETIAQAFAARRQHA